ncbi:MAG: hypothetical protein AAGK21_05520 [Bacteroidota bacterium]
MPQFEIEPQGQPATFVRARSDEDAVRRQTGADDVTLGEAEPGAGWRSASVGGEVWGRVRPRDRMRFRRD